MMSRCFTVKRVMWTRTTQERPVVIGGGDRGTTLQPAFTVCQSAQQVALLGSLWVMRLL
ncbi:Hypothetical predicted protein [Scomber scombrus]|uniref:Uncharacterized protein n=1 Tax=Scomber scombrus TaxID=13677 RepID=A0AAV1Q9Y9_SCOSC